MARRYRRRQHGRRLRTDRAVLARAQGEPRPVLPHRLSRHRQSRLARGERPQQVRQRHQIRSSCLRPAVLRAGLRAQGKPRGAVVMASSASMPTTAARQGQTERADTLALRNARLAPGETVIVRIARSGGADGATEQQEFKVPYQKWMRVLDALNWIAENAATDLAYRWYCGSKMCGTCAVRMNGREVLACWEAGEPEMTIEPLRNLPVVRDLVVDRSPYEQKVASFEPWLRRGNDYPGFPEPLSHKQMKNASKALDCISCMCCYSACPVIRLGDFTDLAGPAPLVQLGQTALDPRNDQRRVAIALAQTGIFYCVSCY